MHRYKLLFLLGLCILTACGRKGPRPEAQPPASALPASTPNVKLADRWTGRWLGPEGTFLEIAPEGGKYLITIRNLDGPRTFPGVRSGDRITFERDGIHESIRAGTGIETAMKWLADKSDCLVVKPGEGYCRG